MTSWLGYFPYPSGASVGVDDTRGEGTKVGDSQVVIADEVELVLVARLIPGDAGVVPRRRRADGPGRPVRVHFLPLSSHVSWRADRTAGVAVVLGLRMRVTLVRMLAHGLPLHSRSG
jgi:hypothetical protein